MSDNGSASDSDAEADATASQGMATGRAGGDSEQAASDPSDRSSYSYSSDPVTGERLGGDLTERFNDQSAAGASATDVKDSAQGQTEQSSGSSDTGSAQTSAVGSHEDLPDYAKETYRTEDDERDEETHRSSHGFTHGL